VSVLAISYFFHLIATVIWIGGLVLMVILVWPEVSRSLAENPARYRLLSRLRHRFTPWANFSLVMLIVTGLIQMSGNKNYVGVLQFSNDWAKAILLKHIAVAGMIVCGLILQFTVTPALERASLLAEKGKGDPTEWAKLRRREVRLTWINVLLGMAVLAFTAWATAI
jgi:uncharacterized membrane protein